MRRVQGSEWDKIRPHVNMLDIYECSNGHMRGIYQDRRNGKQYVHWLNDDEIKEFKAIENSIHF